MTNDLFVSSKSWSWSMESIKGNLLFWKLYLSEYPRGAKMTHFRSNTSNMFNSFNVYFFLVWCLIKLWLSKDIEYFTWIFPHRNKWLQYMSYYYKRWFYEMHIDNGKSFPKTIIPILVFLIKIPWKISIHDFDALYFYFVDTLVGTFCDSSPVC